jgi:molybdenum cofactor cytidylyltransferase
MPVDPGNLLLLGTLRGATVLGVPGCARSLKRSGFDAVLERACAGVPIAGEDIAAMGVGGLLEEVSARWAPRERGPGAGDDADGAEDAGAEDAAGAAAAGPRVAAIVLAAGRASRMGTNKLVAELDGEPIVRRTVSAALASRARPVVVVTGHEADAVRGALAGLDVVFAHNPSYADGMSTSLRAGLQAIGPAAASAALICLGDMPRLAARHLDEVIAAHRDDETIVVPTCDRKRGNPVLWPRRYFAEMTALAGDVGARALIERHAEHVLLLPIDDPAILLDVDTPAALAALTRSVDGDPGGGDPHP